MPFFRITIWTSRRVEPFRGVRQFTTDKIEAVQQTLEKRCRKYYGVEFRSVEVVMLSLFSQEVREYQNRQAITRSHSPLPSRLLGIAVDSRTGEYIIEEDGITYRMDFASFVALKNYYKGEQQEPLSSWYKGLDDLLRKKVVRTGVVKNGNPDDSCQ